MTTEKKASDWSEAMHRASRTAHEAYLVAFRALEDGSVPRRRRAQLAEVVHWLSMASMRLDNLVRWEARDVFLDEEEVERYAHFRAVLA